MWEAVNKGAHLWNVDLRNCNLHYHRTPLQWRTRDYSCRCPSLNLQPTLSLENRTHWDQEKRRWKEVKRIKMMKRNWFNAKDNWYNDKIYLQASKSSLNLSSVNSSRRSLNSFVQPDITKKRSSLRPWWSWNHYQWYETLPTQPTNRLEMSQDRVQNLTICCYHLILLLFNITS